jgi:integrase
MRLDNPAKGIERYPEQKRERYLSTEELKRLSGVLAKHPEQSKANVIRLLLLTGARRGEVFGAH